jgi:GntR family transcriptional regulator
MWYHVDPHSGVPIYVQLKEQVKKAVASGQLRSGEQLPSVRELAIQLTINPNTVSKVYQELEREGIIQTARGLGTFVSERGTEFGGKQDAALDKALEALMVEAYQLAVNETMLREKFEKKLSAWKTRFKGDGEHETGN